VNARLGQFPADPHAAGEPSRITRFLVSGDTPKKNPAPPPSANDACAFWEARAGEAKVEATGPKTVRVRYAGQAPPAKCADWPADVMKTIGAYGTRKLERMERRISELNAELARFGPGPYPPNSVPALDSAELGQLPDEIASYRAHRDRRDEIEMCAFWYAQNHLSASDVQDDAPIAYFEQFCKAPPPRDAADACAFWDRAGVMRPRACYSYDRDVMKLAEWLSFNTSRFNGTAKSALCTLHVIQDLWPAAQFLGATNKRELIQRASEIASANGCY
jgi:hypothetical protein